MQRMAPLMIKSIDNPIPLPASPLKGEVTRYLSFNGEVTRPLPASPLTGEVTRDLPFKGRAGVGMGCIPR